MTMGLGGWLLVQDRPPIVVAKRPAFILLALAESLTSIAISVDALTTVATASTTLTLVTFQADAMTEIATTSSALTDIAMGAEQLTVIDFQTPPEPLTHIEMSSDMAINCGDIAILRSTWKAYVPPSSTTRVLTTPTVCTALVTPPTSSGLAAFTITRTASANGQIFTDGVGLEHAEIPIPPASAGHWLVRWKGTGSAAGEEEQRFSVEA